MVSLLCNFIYKIYRSIQKTGGQLWLNYTPLKKIGCKEYARQYYGKDVWSKIIISKI